LTYVYASVAGFGRIYTPVAPRSSPASNWCRARSAPWARA